MRSVCHTAPARLRWAALVAPSLLFALAAAVPVPAADPAPVAPVVPADDKHHDIRPRLRPGVTMDFVMTTDSTVDLKADNTKVALRGRLTGTLTYAAIGADGQPSAARVTFGPDCSVKQTADGKTEDRRFPLAGKTVNLKRGADGAVTHDAKDVDAQTDGMLRKLLTVERTVYPTAPVSIGDEWEAQPEQLPPEMTLGGRAKADVRSKLVKVGDVRGRKAYDVVLTGKVAGEVQPGTAVTMEFGGLTQIDAEFGVPAYAEMSMSVSLKDARQGYDMRVKVEATYTFKEAGATTGPVTRP